MHPVLASITLPGFGPRQMVEAMKAFPHTHALLALMRDGFHEQSPADRWGLRRDGSPLLDYRSPIRLSTARGRALLAWPEIRSPAGAKSGVAGARDGQAHGSWAEAKALISAGGLRF